MKPYSVDDMIADAVEKATLNLTAQRDGAYRERDTLRLELGERDALIRSLRTEMQNLRRLVDQAGAGQPGGAAKW